MYNLTLNGDYIEERRWIPNNDFTKLQRMFYIENIFKAVNFV